MEKWWLREPFGPSKMREELKRVEGERNKILIKCSALLEFLIKMGGPLNSE